MLVCFGICHKNYVVSCGLDGNLTPVLSWPWIRPDQPWSLFKLDDNWAGLSPKKPDHNELNVLTNPTRLPHLAYHLTNLHNYYCIPRLEILSVVMYFVVFPFLLTMPHQAPIQSVILYFLQCPMTINNDTPSENVVHLGAWYWIFLFTAFTNFLTIKNKLLSWHMNTSICKTQPFEWLQCIMYCFILMETTGHWYCRQQIYFLLCNFTVAALEISPGNNTVCQLSKAHGKCTI